MKAVLVFILVFVVGMGYVMFNSWILTEQPTHVIHVKPPPEPAPPKKP